MEVVHTEINRGNKCIVYNGYTYRKMYTLKNGDVVYRFSTQKNCKASVTTDENEIAIIRTRAVHDHEGNFKRLHLALNPTSTARGSRYYLANGRGAM
jgi:hypothetical protein